MTNLVDVEDLISHFETTVYYCVSIEEDAYDLEADRLFLPKTIATRDGDTYIMPEDYASEKGFI